MEHQWRPALAGPSNPPEGGHHDGRKPLKPEPVPLTTFTITHRPLSTGEPTSPWCWAWRRPWRCSLARWSSATRCAAACATSRSAGSGETDQVLSSMGFFREDLSNDLKAALGATATAPLIVADAFVTLESSGRRASKVIVYGVDERFWAFHGLAAPEGVVVSPALASEVGAKEGDVLLTRLQKPSEVPIESLFGRKEDVGRTVRLTLAGVLPRDRLGEFSVKPQQADVRAVFAPLRRLQRDLAVPGQVNTILVAGGERTDARLRAALRLEDLGVRVATVESPRAIVTRELERHRQRGARDGCAQLPSARLGLQPVPVFTYLANSIRKGDRQIPYSLIAATDPELAAAAPADRECHGAGRGRDCAERMGRARAWRRSRAIGSTSTTTSGTRPSASSRAARRSRLSRVVPIAGLAADRRLAPDYPGITGANSLADWDPPFPIDLSRVRPADERYWDDHRDDTEGVHLLRARPRPVAVALRRADLDSRADSRRRRCRRAGRDVFATSCARRSRRMPWASRSIPARAAALDAAQGATDFGQYFTYFSFFLMVSALMLAVLFFKLGVEQRLRQIGDPSRRGLLDVGRPAPAARRGDHPGCCWRRARDCRRGALRQGSSCTRLGTWWVGAVGTTMLELHVRPLSLVLGAVGGVVAATLCVLVSLRAVARLSPRALLTAQSLDVSRAPNAAGCAPQSPAVGAAALVAAVGLLALGFARPVGAGRGVLRRGGGAARRRAALAGRLAARAGHAAHHWPRRLGRRRASGSAAPRSARRGACCRRRSSPRPPSSSSRSTPSGARAAS